MTALVRWTGLAHRFPVLVTTAVLLLAVAAAVYSAYNLGIDTDDRGMLAADLPFQQAGADFDRAFPGIDEPIAVVIHAPTRDEAQAFTKALVDRLAAREQAILGAFEPSVHPVLVRNGLLYVATDELTALLRDLTSALPLLEQIRRTPSLDVLLASLSRAAQGAQQTGPANAVFDRLCDTLARVVLARLAGDPQPLPWSSLTAEPNTNVVRVVTVQPVLDFGSLEPAESALEAIDEEVARLRPAFADRVRVGVTGAPTLRAEELESVVSGIGLSLAVSLVLVATLLWLAFRSIALAVITLVCLIATLVLTAGFATLAVGTLNLISIAFVVLLVGLGLDFSIHLLLHVQEGRRRGADTASAVQDAMVSIGAALALCAPTTALAFLAFVPTDFVGMAQLGLIGGTGVIIAFFVAVTLSPALLALLPSPRPGRPAQPQGLPLRGSAWRRVGGPLALVTTLLGIGGIALLPFVRFDADPMSLRDPDSASVRVFHELAADESTTPYRLNMVVEDAQTAKAVAEALRVLLRDARVRTLASFVPNEQTAKLALIEQTAGRLATLRRSDLGASIERAVTNDGPAVQAARLREKLANAPPTSAAAWLAWALAAFEADGTPDRWSGLERDVFRYWPQFIARIEAQLSPERVTQASLPTPLKEQFLAHDGRQRIEIAPRGDVRDLAERRRFVEAVERVVPRASGSALSTLRAGEVVSQAMITATGLAFAVVAALLWLVLRRARKVLLVLLPLALAAVLTCATSVLMDMPFNYANVIVLPLLIGIGVDSGIHLVERSESLRDQGTIYATSTPRAVFFSALTTVAAFGSLALSDHRGTAGMGALLAIGIGFTLLTMLVVLPEAMARLGKRRLRGRTASETWRRQATGPT